LQADFQEVKMTANILLAYASTYGSTQEVAQSIAEKLRSSGFAVEMQSAKQVKSLYGYSAVVLGAPLYMFHWHADARHFLTKYRGILESLPVAIFALGPFHNEQKEMTSAREQLDKELAQFPWLKPAAVELFPGKFDPARLRLPYNLIPALKKMPASDERDWPAIQAWAAALPEGLHLA
jgi:menaquinone-dependent protoporphyrinogen oxidase